MGWLRVIQLLGCGIALIGSGLADDRILTSSPTNKLLVRIDDRDPSKLAFNATVAAFRIPAWAPEFMILDVHGNTGSLQEQLKNEYGITWSKPLLPRARQPRSFVLNDTLARFDSNHRGYQWHLQNTGQFDAVAGIDLNVLPIWDRFRGAGVTIAILDDAVQISHPDIAPGSQHELHFNWINEPNSTNPEGSSSEEHGTACAGLAAGRGGNGMGIAGVAPAASIAGLRMLGNFIDDEIEGESLAHASQDIQVKTSSWGPPDGSTMPDGPAELAAAALQHGAMNGRDGRGTIYVWAAGNGRDDGDQANLDGYGNSIYTIAVGSVSDRGHITDYGELGANVMIAAPSDGGTQGITTTDLLGIAGKNSGFSIHNYRDSDYRNDFGGTSASAPQVAGVAALMLEANPALGWRDVQEILLRSGRPIAVDDEAWQENQAGLRVHPSVGAGLLDATKATRLALSWFPLGDQQKIARDSSDPVKIPDNDTKGISIPFAFENPDFRVEHVTVAVDLSHPAKSQLRISVISPSGTVSPLAYPHQRQGNDPDVDYDWTFSSVFHWGENLAGNWLVQISDETAGVSGTLNALELTIFGSNPNDLPTTYAQWQLLHFANGEAGKMDDDPDGDGDTNFMEYAFATHPRIPSAARIDSSGYRRGAGLKDVRFIEEFSQNLQDWAPTPSEQLASENPREENIRFLTPGDSLDGYFRVRVVPLP